jgi:hypothetical protein
MVAGAREVQLARRATPPPPGRGDLAVGGGRDELHLRALTTGLVVVVSDSMLVLTLLIFNSTGLAEQTFPGSGDPSGRSVF